MPPIRKTDFTRSAIFSFYHQITLISLFIGMLVIWGGPWTAALNAQSTQQPGSGKDRPNEEADIRRMEMGQPIEREIMGGQIHRYQITVSVGEFLDIVIDQRGIDLVAMLFGPDGNRLLVMDSPNGLQGPEPVKWIAEVSGIYRLEVQSLEKGAAPGSYSVKSPALRTASAQDRYLTEATNLYYESRVAYKKGEYARAISLAERAGAAREKLQDRMDPETAGVLEFLASLYCNNGEYDRAKPLFRRALAIREKVQGEEHPDTLSSLNGLAYPYLATGNYAEAEPLLRRALTVRERTLGAEHPDTATSLDALARLYQYKSDYPQAESLFRRALEIREKALRADDPLTAASLNNLASLYYDQGDYSRAEPLYRRVLMFCERVRGADHYETGIVLNNLAALYTARGDFAQGEKFYRRSLGISEKAFGAEHPEMAASLSNLAELYRTIGDYTQAEVLLQRALAIYEKTLGAEHPNTTLILNNLALLYSSQGKYEQAEPLYQRSLAIREKVLGPDHRYTASALNNLAHLYLSKGNSTQAAPMLRRAVEIREKVLGPNHPETANSLTNLAYLYLGKGENTQADPMLRRALAIREKSLGAEHPDVAISLNDLASLAEATGDISQALALRSRAQSIEERNLAINLGQGSERQKLAYLATLSDSTYHSVSLHLRYAPENSIARDLAITAILQRKGRVLDAMSDDIEPFRRNASSKDRALFDQLKDRRAHLARLVFGGVQQGAPVEYQQAIKRDEASLEKLEAEIGARSREFRAESRLATLAAVQAAVPSDAILLEYFVYRPVKTSSLYSEERLGSPRYVAYLIRRKSEPAWVELGETKAIDEAVQAFRRALHDPRSKGIKRFARQLNRLIMQPLRASIGKMQNVLVSPDGALNLIPFAALVDEQNRYLGERHSFTYLTSGRDLLRFRPVVQGAKAPVILANPDFGERPAEQKRNSSVGILDLTEAYFSPLAATAEEAQTLKRLLPRAIVLTGAKATETALKEIAGPEILHIATHGFFLAGKPFDAVETERQRKLLQQPGDWASRGAGLENPLLRSGLGLAGANLQKSGYKQEEDDGILTAMEVAGLNLWGTKLVVLSACETGVGEVRTGEGVYGLRRALVLAGAETQVMSLWAVSDRGTRDLMIDYYKRLQMGEGRSEAMRQAQLRMLKDPRRRHPFYWASFIVSGEGTPLAGR